MQIDGSNPKAIGLQSIKLSDPSWSPDGKSIAYTGCQPPPSKSALSAMVCNLFTITLDAATTERVTTGIFLDWNPDWGASGIVFVSNRSGSPALWLVNPDGSSLHQLTNPPSTLDLHPKWNRSTNGVVFTRAADSTDIWSKNPAGVESRITSASLSTATSTVLSLVPSSNLTSGEALTVTAVVTAAVGTAIPSGTVTFASPMGGPTVVVALDDTGKAVLKAAVPPLGTYSLNATYSGGGGFAPSVSPTITKTVASLSTATSTVLSLVPSSNLTSGEALTVTAVVTAAVGTAIPSGTVTFASPMGGPTVVVALDDTGKAVLKAAVPPLGTYSLNATYSGGGGFAPSVSPTITKTVTMPSR